MRFLLYFTLIAMISSCSRPQLKTGTWRGVIAMQNQELPFTFEVEKKDATYQVFLKNATERILLDEIKQDGDSVSMILHVFDAKLRARIHDNELVGTFVKHYAPSGNLPFRATWGEDYRFAPNSDEAKVNFAGKYQIEFKTEKDTYPAVGIFEQTGNAVTGTFLTPTGDYRYLEGNVINDQLFLSAFDGNHAFIFTAQLQGDSLSGDFYSGKTAHETFRGIRNVDAVMPDAESLTYLKEGYDKIDFRFPDLNGNTVTPADARFQNKVLILQIFGTWCPNCMDETKFLTSWYTNNRDRGVEILGLAYERKDDFAYASDRVKKMKEKWNVPYDFVIAGVNDKEKAAATLPMLSKVLAFPTTIFIGRDGKVKHIHTGFSGPGTGIYYEQFVQRFNEVVNEMLAEKGR
ncbi:MAG: peroxiredoxin family protein [Cyclobacteriaceae bacterium]|jgi:thiol-disulfide isomerase/thioredoxin